MLFAYIELPPRPGETLAELVTRVEAIRQGRREMQALTARMHKEKQFNRKVELNARIRDIQGRLEDLQ